MVIRNTSDYPTEEVRELVRFAARDVDMRRVCVNVKNVRSHATSGMAYWGVPLISNAPPSSEYLVTLRIGSPDRFPCEHVYPGKSASLRGWPRVELEDWREGLVHIAAHEAKHIEQYREHLSASELRCEHFAASVLRSYRESRAASEETARPTAIA
jgi:hypothetical protein